MEMDPIARKCIAACWPLVIGVIARVRGMLGEAAGHPDSLEALVRPGVHRHAEAALRPRRAAQCRRIVVMCGAGISTSAGRLQAERRASAVGWAA